MSFVAREARREHIQHIMRIIKTTIRPELQRAMTEDTEATYASNNIQEPRTVTTTSNVLLELPYYPELEPGTADGATTMHAAVSTEPNATPDLTCPADTAAQSPCNGPMQPLSQDVSGEPKIGSATSNSTAAPILRTDSSPATPALESITSEHIEETASILFIDESFSGRLAISLQHLQSHRPLPQGIFKGATPNDLRTLDGLYMTLKRMVKGIDKAVAAIERRLTTRGRRTLAPATPRVTAGQEEWQTPGAKKIVWNVDADWDSEEAWEEVVERKQDEAYKPITPSKLRHKYIPSEWWCKTEEVSSWEEENGWSW